MSSSTGLGMASASSQGLIDDLFELASSVDDRRSLEQAFKVFTSRPENAKVALDEYLISCIVEKEADYFLFENTNIVVRLLEEDNQTILKKKFIRYAAPLGIIDPYAAPILFDYLDVEGSGSIPVSLFYDFVNGLKKAYEPLLKWDDSKARLELAKDEILLEHSPFVTNNADDGIGPAGSLYLSKNYLYFESPALNRQKLIPLSAISSISKKRTGVSRVENMIEIFGDGASTKPITFTFYEGCDRWYDYIKDMMEHFQHDRPAGDCLKSIVVHNIHISRALREILDKPADFLLVCSNHVYRQTLIDGILNKSLEKLISVYDKIPPYIYGTGDNLPLSPSYQPFEYHSFVDNLTTTIRYAKPFQGALDFVKDILSWKNRSTSILALIVCLFLVYIDLVSHLYYFLVACNVGAFFLAPIYGIVTKLNRTPESSPNPRHSLSPSMRKTLELTDVRKGSESDMQVSSIEEIERKYTNSASIFSVLRSIESITKTSNQFAGKIKSIATWKDSFTTQVYLLLSSLVLITIKLLPTRILWSIGVIVLFSSNYILSKDSLVRPWIDFGLNKWNEIPISPAKL